MRLALPPIPRSPLLLLNINLADSWISAVKQNCVIRFSYIFDSVILNVLVS